MFDESTEEINKNENNKSIAGLKCRFRETVWKSLPPTFVEVRTSSSFNVSVITNIQSLPPSDEMKNMKKIHPKLKFQSKHLRFEKASEFTFV